MLTWYETGDFTLSCRVSPGFTLSAVVKPAMSPYAFGAYQSSRGVPAFEFSHRTGLEPIPHGVTAIAGSTAGRVTATSTPINPNPTSRFASLILASTPSSVELRSNSVRISSAQCARHTLGLRGTDGESHKREQLRFHVNVRTKSHPIRPVIVRMDEPVV